MNKPELMNAIKETALEEKSRSLTLPDIEAVLDGLEWIICKELAGGNIAAIPGIGRLVPKKRGEKFGRNPKTGAKVVIPPSVVVRFKPSAVVKRSLPHKLP